jgi:hypothetical protein
MGFGLGETIKSLGEYEDIDSVYRVGINEWQGERKLQLFLLDVKVA